MTHKDEPVASGEKMSVRINLFQAGDGSMCISHDESYRGNIPYVPESSLTALRERLEKEVGEARRLAIVEVLEAALRHRKEQWEDFITENLEAARQSSAAGKEDE